MHTGFGRKTWGKDVGVSAKIVLRRNKIFVC